MEQEARMPQRAMEDICLRCSVISSKYLTLSKFRQHLHDVSFIWIVWSEHEPDEISLVTIIGKALLHLAKVLKQVTQCSCVPYLNLNVCFFLASFTSTIIQNCHWEIFIKPPYIDISSCTLHSSKYILLFWLDKQHWPTCVIDLYFSQTI